MIVGQCFPVGKRQDWSGLWQKQRKLTLQNIGISRAGNQNYDESVCLTAQSQFRNGGGARCAGYWAQSCAGPRGSRPGRVLDQRAKHSVSHQLGPLF